MYAPDFLSATGAPAVTSGVWTPLNNQPSFFASAGAFLLTDGRVLVEDAQLTDVAWWTLTPDNTGSYINGTWTKVASPGPCPNGKNAASTMYAPLYYASAVLTDGRFVMIGGEYDYNYTYVTAGSGEVWTDQGAIYDPVANSWTCIAPPTGWTEIGDAQSVVLADGTFMIANPFNNQVATLNAGTNPPTFNAPFTPAGKTADSFNDEEGWILLPNGNVFTTEVWNSNDATETPALVYSPITDMWSSAGIAPDPLVLISKGGVNYFETGPALLRPDGTVFASGGTGFNDIFDTGSSTWSSGPSFPTVTGTYNAGSCHTVGVTEQLVAADAPAALLPDGNVLIAPGPVDSQSACEWVPPTVFFEFDGTSLTQVAQPTVAAQVPSYVGRLLVLPTGQVLYTDTAQFIELYTPAGSPNASWAPTIATSPATVSAGGTNYPLTGTQFNGLSQAVQLRRRLPGRHQLSAGANHQQCERARLLCAHAQPQHDGGGDGECDGLDAIRRAGEHRRRCEYDCRRRQRDRVFIGGSQRIGADSDCDRDRYANFNGNGDRLAHGDGDRDSNRHRDRDFYSDGNGNYDSDGNRNSNGDCDAHGDCDVNGDRDSDADSFRDTDLHSYSVRHADAHLDCYANGDSDSNAIGDGDGNIDANGNSDVDGDRNSDANGDSDADRDGNCYGDNDSDRNANCN